MRTCVVQVFTFDKYLGTAEMVTEVFSKGEGRWPTRVVGHQVNIFFPEGFITTASGDFSHAAGAGASATNDNTYVWADATGTSSTTTKQFTVHADNGIRLLGAAGVEVEGTLAATGNATVATNLTVGADLIVAGYVVVTGGAVVGDATAATAQLIVKGGSGGGDTRLLHEAVMVC